MPQYDCRLLCVFERGGRGAYGKSDHMMYLFRAVGGIEIVNILGGLELRFTWPSDFVFRGVRPSLPSMMLAVLLLLYPR